MSKMTKWVVQWDAGLVGTDTKASYYGTESQEEVEAMFHPDVIEWFDSYSHDDLQDDDGEVDEMAMEDRRSELSAYAEVYEPEKHDGLLCSDEKWTWDVEKQP